MQDIIIIWDPITIWDILITRGILIIWEIRIIPGITVGPKITRRCMGPETLGKGTPSEEPLNKGEIRTIQDRVDRSGERGRPRHPAGC